MTARAGEALRATVALATPVLRAAAVRVWLAPAAGRRYPRYLRTMHGVIRASVPLMDLAARRCAERASTDPVADPVAGPLRQYLLEHIEQERGHDDWLLADLAVLDRSPGPPPAATSAVARLVGAQYYWIEHHHPVALLGYIAVMEGNAPSAALPAWLANRAGVPAAALRAVREHADLDGGHTDAVYDLLNRLPLTTAQAHAVAVSGLHTVDALITIFAGLAAQGTEGDWI